ncbi:MAG: uridine kinase [Mycoplasma sp.]
MVKKHKKPILICVSGGTASGKTTAAKLILSNLPKSVKTVMICMDNFYKDISYLDNSIKLTNTKNSNIQRINYDHPYAFDWQLITNTLKDLLKRKTVQIPNYDYVTGKRLKQTKTIKPADVIIFEGILAIHNPDINNLSAIKIFVESPDDERFIRRFLRDKCELKRTDEEIINRWRKLVQPMYKQFCQQQRADADLIIPWFNQNDVAIELLKSALTMRVLHR